MQSQHSTTSLLRTDESSALLSNRPGELQRTKIMLELTAKLRRRGNANPAEKSTTEV